jgi:lipoprotein-releasing system ATP-binding protein
MSDQANDTLLHIENLHKHYRMGSEDLHVLRGVDLSIRSGEWLGIFGASGSGKSTLLHLIGGLDTPDDGSVHFHDRNVFRQSAAARDRFRNRHVGFVFQFYHLLPELNVLENAMLAAMITTPLWRGIPTRSKVRHETIALLERLGLGERLRHRPNELSGGERQRVAIARALINQPDVLLADEPTGNLDRATGERIMDLLAELHRAGQTIAMVSHDPSVTERADRVLRIESGRLVRESAATT